MVEDGVTGFLFTDAVGLEAKVTRLVEDPELHRQMGLAGEARVRSCQPEQEVDEYLAQCCAATKALAISLGQEEHRRVGLVVPAEAGTQNGLPWIPAFTGKTRVILLGALGKSSLAWSPS